MRAPNEAVEEVLSSEIGSWRRDVRGASCIWVLILAAALPAQTTFVQGDVVAEGGGAVAVADFTGDGLQDVAVVSIDFSTIVLEIFQGDAVGGLTALATGPVPPPGFIDRIIPVDVDGDSDVDIVVAMQNIFGQSALAVLVNQGNGTVFVTNPLSTGNNPESPHFVDFDNDTITDLVVVSGFAGVIGDVAILRGLGGGAFAPPQVLLSSGGLDFKSLAVGDLDGNGSPDLAALAPGTLVVAYNDGVGNVASQATAPAPIGVSGMLAGEMRIVDWDVNGTPEIYAQAAALILPVPQSTDILRWEAGPGGTWTAAPPLLTLNGSLIERLDFLDLDQDGDPDLGLQRAGVAIHWNDGAGGVVTNTVGGVFPLLNNVQNAFYADVDNDGDADVVASGTGACAVHHNLSTAITVVGTPATGTTVVLDLDSPSDALRSYVGGFALGDQPGIPLPDGRIIPLTPDPLWQLSLQVPNPFFQGVHGTLDAAGQGSMSVSIPPVPGLAGLQVFASFVTLRQVPGGIQIGSIATPPARIVVQ